MDKSNHEGGSALLPRCGPAAALLVYVTRTVSVQLVRIRSWPLCMKVKQTLSEKPRRLTFIDIAASLWSGPVFACLTLPNRFGYTEWVRQEQSTNTRNQENSYMTQTRATAAVAAAKDAAYRVAFAASDAAYAAAAAAVPAADAVITTADSVAAEEAYDAAIATADAAYDAAIAAAKDIA